MESILKTGFRFPTVDEAIARGLKLGAAVYFGTRVAELGSLSSGAKMAMKIFFKRVFTIFATNALFFARNRKFANLTQ